MVSIRNNSAPVRFFGQQDIYAFHGGFNAYLLNESNDGHGELIGSAKASFYNDENLSIDRRDVGDLSDMIGSGLRGALHEIARNNLYQGSKKSSIGASDYHTCFIKNLYINPTMSNHKGIESFLTENITDVIEFFFRVNLSCLIIRTKPYFLDPVDGEWIDVHKNKDDGAQRKLKKALLKANFTKTGKNMYAKMNI